MQTLWAAIATMVAIYTSLAYRFFVLNRTDLAPSALDSLREEFS